MPADLSARIDAIASDHASGASAVLDAVMDVLQVALAGGADLPTVARAICLAQPAMAPVWTAAAEAVASVETPGRFEVFAERVRRAPAALTRHATTHFRDEDAAARPLRLVTISSSRAVATVIDAIRHVREIHVACSESRPALEGRGLARALADQGTPVTFYSDAAIGTALTGADAVLVGADAVGADWFINKCATQMLAAAAGRLGIPVYVVATREKFVGEALATRLQLRGGAPAEIWDAAPAGVEVRNPYFESTPLDLVTAVISDMGVLGAGMVPDVCRAVHDAAAVRALDEIGSGPSRPG